MTAQKRRLDYPISYIRMLLEHYTELSEGRWPIGDSFENAIIAKADIDKAIDDLDDIEKEVVMKLNIEGYPVCELEKRIENVRQIEQRAVRHMAAYLNREYAPQEFNR